MEPTSSSETSAFLLRTPGKFPKEHRLHSEHGESLKTTKFLVPRFEYPPSLQVGVASSPPHTFTPPLWQTLGILVSIRTPNFYTLRWYGRPSTQQSVTVWVWLNSHCYGMPHFVGWGPSFSGFAWDDASKVRRSKSLFTRKCLRNHRLRDQTTARCAAVTASGARQYTLSRHGPPESTTRRLTVTYKTDFIAPGNPHKLDLTPSDFPLRRDINL